MRPGWHGAKTAVLLLLPIWGMSKPICGQVVAKTDQITFTYERAGMPVPKYKLVLDRDGRGSYLGEQAAPVIRGVVAEPASMGFERRYSLSGDTTGRIFALAAELNHFDADCASKAKNVASSGKKVLAYTGSDGAGLCAYDYTENKNVEALTDLFEGIAETMDVGRVLDHLHRFDRLGLDAELDLLTQEAAASRALELETIAETLRSIAEDADVMQRARGRARALLAMIPAEARQVGLQ